MSQKRDYYEILGVAKNASQDEIKKAFKKKAKELHPDRNSDKPDAEADFKELNEAHDVLKDEQKRSAYDRMGHAAFDSGMNGGFGRTGGQNFNFDFSDVFNDLFGEFVRQNNRNGGATSRSRRGADLRYNMKITLKEAFKGISKDIKFRSTKSCDDCHGTGAKSGEMMACEVCNGHGTVSARNGFFAVERTCGNCGGFGRIPKEMCYTCDGKGAIETDRNLSVKIPAGVDTGTRIRLSGEGEAGLFGGPNGDLYVFLEVEEDAIFKRDGNDLRAKVGISFATAALGGEVELETIDGNKTKLKIHPGTQSGTQMRLRGKGMPVVQRPDAGDLIVEVSVQVPVDLTAKQKELLQEFEKVSQKSEQGFFSKWFSL